MSIEKAIENLTAALNRNSDIVEAHTAALHKLGGGAATKTTKATASTKTDDAGDEDDAAAKAKADKAAKAKAAKEKAAKEAAAAKAAEEADDGDAVTVEDAAERVTAYLKTGSKEERAENKANVAKIIEHYGVARFTAIPQDSLAEALGYLEDFAEGRTPEFMADADDDNDDDDGDDVI